jgi:Domain of Unknown Function (DUF748)
MRDRWGRFRRSRSAKILLVVLGFLLLLALILDRALDEPIRKAVERRINAALEGYTARVHRADFHLVGLSLTLEDVGVSQDAHPEPAVLSIPRLAMGVQWMALLSGRLVADCTIQSPSIYADLEKLQEENRDEIPLEDRGWQDALRAIYPLKINKMLIHDGSLVYRETSSARPLEASQVELAASNIRNIRSKERVYPSPVRLAGKAFEQGSFEIVGHADFLAKPHPGIKAKIELDRLDLAYFEPVLEPYAVRVSKGLLSGSGRVEKTTGLEIVDLDQVVLDDTSVDYLYGGEAHQKARVVAREIRDTAKKSLNASDTLYRIRHMSLRNGTIGLVNRTVQPSYRLFVSGARFDLENLSTKSEDGAARATLTGTLMGSGKVDASAQFFPEGKEANFGLKLEIAETHLTNMNQLLKAHGNFDVVGGDFSLYMDMRVRDRQVRGYLKPLFRNVNVYDPEQDKHDKPMHKLYEKLVGVAAKILKNQKNEEIATVANISGPVESPKSSALEIIGNLLQNAFVKSILPGFENEVSKVNPAYYRSWKKSKKESGKSSRS